MTNQLTFTPDENRLLLERTYNGTKFSAADYQFISSIIEQRGGVDAATRYWFSQADEINGNVPDAAANVFIRSVTSAGLLWAGTPVGDLQAVSNSIRDKVFENLIRENGIPPLADLLSNDISAALQISGQTIGGWGGSFYYWDQPYKNSTIGQLILNSPVEYEKFISVNAYALAVTTAAEVYGGIANFEAVGMLRGALGASALPVEVQEDLIDRFGDKRGHAPFFLINGDTHLFR